MSRQTVEPTAAFAQGFSSIVSNVERVIQGKVEVIQLALLCLLSEGHLLVEDVPGVGKTSLAKALARSIDCTFGRIQFTPDLLPSDVVGVSIYNRSNGNFDFRPGPVFNHMLLGDEINRASPKTQSALLESMAERQVTVDGTTYPLDAPFMVIATQNPIEHEGTYPLPESQLDRFFMQVSVGYPAAAAWSRRCSTCPRRLRRPRDDRAGGHPRRRSLDDRCHAPCTSRRASRATSCRSPTRPATTRASRSACPRALSSTCSGPRSRAPRQAGRSYIVPDDIKALAESVLGHRLVITPEAQLAGIRPGDVLREILQTVPVPSGRTK